MVNGEVLCVRNFVVIGACNVDSGLIGIGILFSANES